MWHNKTCPFDLQIRHNLRRADSPAGRSATKRPTDKKQSRTKEKDWQTQNQEKYSPVNSHDEHVVKKQKK
jgi:hypothetical protein